MWQLLLQILVFLLLQRTESTSCGIVDISWTQPVLEISFCDDVDLVSTSSFYIHMWPSGSTGATTVHTTAVFSSASAVSISINGTLRIDLSMYVSSGTDFYVSGLAGTLQTSSGSAVPAFRTGYFSMLVITTTTLKSAGGASEDLSDSAETEDDDDEHDGDSDSLFVPDVSIDLVEDEQVGSVGGTGTWVKVLLIVGVALGVLGILALGAYEIRQIAKRRARTRKKLRKELRKSKQDRDVADFQDLEDPSPDSPPATPVNPYKRSSSLHAFKMGIMQSTKSGRATQTQSFRSNGSQLSVGEAPGDSPPILDTADAGLPGQTEGFASSTKHNEETSKAAHADE